MQTDPFQDNFLDLNTKSLMSEQFFLNVAAYFNFEYFTSLI